MQTDLILKNNNKSKVTQLSKGIKNVLRNRSSTSLKLRKSSLTDFSEQLEESKLTVKTSHYITVHKKTQIHRLIFTREHSNCIANNWKKILFMIETKVCPKIDD